MQYKVLGKTGLKVSSIGFGSVELGMDYGIKVPGRYGKPNKETAKQILHQALDSGINLFDTAPGYGDSESLLGAYIGDQECYFATKITIAKNDNIELEDIERKIGESLKKLRRECIDILQVHNTTAETGGRDSLLAALDNLRKKGLIRFLGVSVYGAKDAMAAIEGDFFDVIQIAYSILDQRMREKIIPALAKNNIGVLSRSAYFRGMLTEKIEHLDEEWRFLKDAVAAIKNKFNITDWDDLMKLALKFCLAQQEIDSVLVGIHNPDELAFAVATGKEAKLDKNTLDKLLTLGIKDNYWVEPLNWYRRLL